MATQALDMTDFRIYINVKEDAVYHKHYCRAGVHIFRDYNTAQITVKAHIGTAPDSTTIIVYPYSQDAYGYWNKAKARKIAANFKANLKVFIKANGIKLSDRIEVSEPSCW